MLIHEQDYLMIDLEKSSSNYLYSDNIMGYGVKLVITAQINGKLRRSILDLEVLPLASFNKLHRQENQASSDDKPMMINNYHGLYAVLDMLHDFGYKLKDNQFDQEYMGIIKKIQDGVCFLYAEIIEDERTKQLKQTV